MYETFDMNTTRWLRSTRLQQALETVGDLAQFVFIFLKIFKSKHFITRNIVDFKIWQKWQNKLHLSIFDKMKKKIVAKIAWWFPHLKDFPNKNNAIKAKCKNSWGHPSQKLYNYHLDLLQVQRNSSFFVALQIA